MKALVCMAAIAAAGASLAIESANVVGYQQTSLGTNGSKMMITPTFVNVTDEEYPIDDFKIIGATKDKQADIQVMDKDGTWVGHYYWFREYKPKTGAVVPAGWFDGKGSTPAGITIKPGYGVFLNVAANGLSVQSSGQVAGAITNDLVVGKGMYGNASPVEIEINKFAIIGSTKDKQVDIQVMGTDGTWVGHYYWFREYKPKSGAVVPAGWFDGKGSTPAGITLKPGETVFFNVTTANQKLVIPSAL